MGAGADLGTIEPGKLADLVIVDGNPLARITDMRRTRRVIKDGVVYEVDALLRGPIRSAPRGGESPISDRTDGASSTHPAGTGLYLTAACGR